MAQGRFSPLGSRVTETSQVQRGSDGAGGKQCNEEAGNVGKGGKLRLSRTSLFKKKPYDRPLPSGTLDRLSSSGTQIPSLRARIVDSASNLVTSSASYLFHSFFKSRQTRWIDNGIQATAGRASTDAQQSKESKSFTDNSDKHPVESSFQGGGGEKVGGDDMGFMEVEEFLKRQTLSRDEVKRLTEVLHTQVDGGIEASRRHNMVKHASKESNPVQLAKAYMGRRTTPQWQSTPSHYNEVAGPSSRKSLQEGMHERIPVEASRARVTPGSSVRMLKRRAIGDEEDDVIVTGPPRRVRQKMTITANSSPYIRQVTSAVGRPRTPSAAAVQPSEKTEKSPEPLEEPSLPSKGKFLEELVTVSGPSCIEDVPESSKARDSVLESDREASVLPVSNELVETSGKPPEPVVTIPPTALEKPVSGPLAASTPELPASLPDKTGRPKGFRISAFFEDTSSDEEADMAAKASTLTEAQLPRPLSVKEGQDVAMLKQSSMITHDTLLSKEAQDVAMVKQPSMITPDILPSFSAVDSAEIPAPVLRRPIDAAEPPNTKSDSLPVVSSAVIEPPFTFSKTDKLTFSLPSAKPFPALSQVPAMTDKGGESSIVPQSTRAMSLAASSSASLMSSPLPVSTPLPSVSAAEASVWVPGAEAATAAVMPSLSEATPRKETPKRKAERAEREPLGLFSPQPATVSTEVVTPNISTPAATPKFPPASEASVASGSPLPLFAATPPATPAVNQAGMSEAQPVNATATDSPLEARRSPMFESPSAENRQSDMDTMATDPMTEEPESSTLGPSAPASLFGSTSSAVSTPVAAFGSGSGSASSPFSFSMQSSTPSQVSQSPFSSQSSSAASQPFTFGSSGPSPANPFSASSQSNFSFGSSAATSMSSMFPATSSAPLTFPATSPAPSPFLFGAQANSTSGFGGQTNSTSGLTNSTSGFGGQTTPSANAFTSAGAPNNAPAFPFPAPPTTPTPPTFQFGGVSAGTSSLSSTPSFGGQASFAFGGQPANVAANPFAQNAGSNTSPFQFGASAEATASQPVFSSGAAPASNTNFAFGAQPAASPFPFNFGSQQTTAPPTGQPFAFGGQPAAPAPSPFTVPGSTGQGPPGASGMEFAGGFSLGAAGGGEKSGRKFIKAKRIGGPKRGK